MEHFVCTHCGHRFQSEPKESPVCPACFWSTSVKKEEAGEGLKTPSVEVELKHAPSRIWRGVGGFFFVLILAGISFFALHHLQRQKEILHKIETKNAAVIAKEAPELALSPEEQETLQRNVPAESDLKLTPAEKETLDRRAAFRSRSLKGLATPPWDEKQFAAFLKMQEGQYRLPFEWSYRRKLIQLFKQHYLPAAQAFEAKDFLKARNEWIHSLTFPVYQNDPKKHRGVALTILRPYINDVLSKIGTMNAAFTEKDLYAAEEKIQSDYESLAGLLQSNSWEEANAKLLELSKELEGVGKSQGGTTVPPLPPEVSLIDPDIRQVLLMQAAPVQAGVRDWEALRRDLEAKEKVVQNRLPGTQQALRKNYEEALGQIKNENWREARELLQKIDFPETLAEDARAKIKVLDQLIARLDSQEKTG